MPPTWPIKPVSRNRGMNHHPNQAEQMMATAPNRLQVRQRGSANLRRRWPFPSKSATLYANPAFGAAQRSLPHRSERFSRLSAAFRSEVPALVAKVRFQLEGRQNESERWGRWIAKPAYFQRT
jgi:hypothetical protein